MSVCHEMMLDARVQQKRTKMNCPIRVFPKCHPKERVEVFVDGKKGIITLVCGRCDRPISQIHIRTKDAKLDKRAAQ